VIIASSEGRTRIITSWHVIRSAAEGEDLYAVTSDGLMHSLQPSSISRIGDVDLATVEFFAQDTYPVAKIPDSEQIVVGQNVYVSGFPLSTATVPVRLYRFLTGGIISYSPQSLGQGYRLLYNNPTLPGMSGGGVFSASGELLAIHGRAETDARLSEQSGVAVKTNTNLGIPLNGYKNAILKSPGESRSISILKNK
jgi:S1-C subfamily serine protease